MEPLEKLLDPREVAEVLGLKKSTIHRLLAEGAIPSVIVTGSQRRRSFRVKPSVLSRWIAEREVSA